MLFLSQCQSTWLKQSDFDVNEFSSERRPDPNHKLNLSFVPRLKINRPVVGTN